MMALGERYTRGHGVKTDLITAYAWNASALRSGEPDENIKQARHSLARLPGALSDEKLSRAELLSVHLSTVTELHAARSAAGGRSPVFGGGR
jgi:hypothetical protein